MCNLYRLTTPASAVAQLFDIEPAAGANYKDVVAPTDPGLIIAGRQLRATAWGFPRVDISKVTGQPLKPRAVYNTRTERIGSRFWRASFAHRRCLIPVNAWAEPEGQEGAMTRTWFSPPDLDIFAIAGIWQRSAEWGHVFSMLMVPGHQAMADLNDRMPVILRSKDWTTWTEGSPIAALALCRSWEEGLVREPCDESWSSELRIDKDPAKSRQLSLPL
ncbi:hypothetical protein CA833_21270 [Novosphingobium sp. KA1]|nr:hypothetical protein CA833_21270 [Novosphingobium sp. KA1]